MRTWVLCVFLLSVSACMGARVKVLHRAGGTAAMRVSSDSSEGEKFGRCKTCVYMLEKVKMHAILLSEVCEELRTKYPDSYGTCSMVQVALAKQGPSTRQWVMQGCFKKEIYGAQEWITPCPSHVICSELLDLDEKPFCTPLPTEDPFAEASAADSSASS